MAALHPRALIQVVVQVRSLCACVCGTPKMRKRCYKADRCTAVQQQAPEWRWVPTRSNQSLRPTNNQTPLDQVVSDDGGVLACALNAACAALVDAAVPLRTLCTAVAAAQAPGSDGGLLLDPSAAEEAAAAATGTFAYLPLLAGGDSGGSGGSGQVQLLTSLTRGRLSPDQLLDMMEAGGQGAARLAAFMQQSARQQAGAAVGAT